MAIDNLSRPIDTSAKTQFSPLVNDEANSTTGMQAVKGMEPLSTAGSQALPLESEFSQKEFKKTEGVDGCKTRAELYQKLTEYYFQQMGIILSNYLKQLPEAISEEDIKHRFGAGDDQNVKVEFVFPKFILEQPQLHPPTDPQLLSVLKLIPDYNAEAILMIKFVQNYNGVWTPLAGPISIPIPRK